MFSKKLILTAFASLLIFTGIFAQDCRIYFPDRVGSVREMKSYDSKGKLTGSTLQEIIARTPGLSGISIRVKTSVSDANGQETMNSEFEVACENGVFRIDMSDYLSQMLQGYQSMEVELKGDNIAFPASMKAGDVLPDANMNIIVRSNGVQFMNMMVTITDRKVVSKENLTTPAGTFDCYKLSSTSISKTKVLTITSSSTEWIAEGVGIVKSESYNKKGKLTSYMELSRFEK
jgi:hypothetical protein